MVRVNFDRVDEKVEDKGICNGDGNDCCGGVKVSRSESVKKGYHGLSKVSRWDCCLKKFVESCEELDAVIVELGRERDSPRLNDEYFSFKRELDDIKNKAILEAYSRKCFWWKF